MRKSAPSFGPWVAVTLVALVTLGLACPSLLPAARREHPLAVEAWDPPPFDSLGGAVRRDVERYSSRDEYERARADTRTTWRRWRYLSDSLEVVAFGCVPAEADPTRSRRPAVVYCRGSYVQQNQVAAGVPVFHRLAEAGFVVVAPQYRGSEGGEGRDEMGGADVEDVLAALRLAAGLAGVDEKSLYLYGESRGGMMTYQALRDGARVRAAATVGAFTDLDTLFRDDPRSAGMAPLIWPDWDSLAAGIATRRSALRWSDRLRTPLLLLHGGNDDRARPWHSERLAAALRRRGTPHALHVLAGAGHVIGERSRERDSLVVDWFRRHRR